MGSRVLINAAWYDMFAAMDLNADGAVDGDEFAAAQEAGLMPASDG